MRNIKSNYQDQANIYLLSDFLTLQTWKGRMDCS